jgi:hypothetical protein
VCVTTRTAARRSRSREFAEERGLHSGPAPPVVTMTSDSAGSSGVSMASASCSIKATRTGTRSTCRPSRRTSGRARIPAYARTGSHTQPARRAASRSDKDARAGSDRERRQHERPCGRGCPAPGSRHRDITPILRRWPRTPTPRWSPRAQLLDDSRRDRKTSAPGFRARGVSLKDCSRELGFYRGAASDV